MEARILSANGKNLTLFEKTLIMGIVNMTPDSFSDGGDYNTLAASRQRVLKMIQEGADLIDIGGESTRPGASLVEEAEELKRVIPLIEALKEISVPISIDTYKAKVGQAALEAGANIINDVWGFQKEPDLAKVAAQFDVPVILMHNQVGTDYPGEIIEAMRTFFARSIEIALKAGVKEEKIILDPGIGFGKTAQQNILVMHRLKELIDDGYPVLLGTSRKSMIGHILDLPPKERVMGTLATNVMGAMLGTAIIRVHDIREHKEALTVTDRILRGK